MNRSLVLPAMALLCGLVGCRAQEDHKALKNSVTRLEERLTRMDDYLKSLQQGQNEQAQQQSRALQDREAELRTLRELLARQEQQAQEQAKAHERALANLQAHQQQHQQKLQEQMAREKAAAAEKLEAERAETRQRADKERRALQEELQQLRQQAERSERASREQTERLRAEAKAADEERRALRTRLEAAQREQEQRRAQPRPDDRLQAIERLGAERREIERLRAEVMADVQAARHHEAQEPAPGRAPRMTARGADETAKLRAENEQLRDKIEALARELQRSKAAPAPAKTGHDQPHPPAGSIVIHNEEGEVHLHFHGPAPTVTTHGKPLQGAALVMPPPAAPVRAADSLDRLLTPATAPAGPHPPKRLRPGDSAPPPAAPQAKPPVRGGLIQTMPAGPAPEAKPPVRKKQGEGRQIHDDGPVRTFVQALLDAF